MARKRRIIIIRNGTIAEHLVRKPPAPRNLRVWLDACRSQASFQRSAHYATRMGGVWRVYATANLTTQHVRELPTEDAAAMWMLAMASVALTA